MDHTNPPLVATMTIQDLLIVHPLTLNKGSGGSITHFIAVVPSINLKQKIKKVLRSCLNSFIPACFIELAVHHKWFISLGAVFMGFVKAVSAMSLVPAICCSVGALVVVGLVGAIFYFAN